MEAGSAGGPDLQQSQAPRLHVCCASLSCPGGEPLLPQGAGQAVDTKPEHLDLSRRRLRDSRAHPRWQSIAQGGIRTCFHSPPWSDSFRDIRVMCGRCGRDTSFVPSPSRAWQPPPSTSTPLTLASTWTPASPTLSSLSPPPALPSALHSPGLVEHVEVLHSVGC